MKPKITLLRRTYREAAALIIAREDPALSLPGNIALKLHMLACKDCPEFESQVLTLSAWMGKWRNYANNDETNPQTSPFGRFLGSYDHCLQLDYLKHNMRV